MILKEQTPQNPFADYGKIITGNRFVGRKLEIESIRNKVLGQNFGNLAIMGLPRIGKSSLVWQALANQKSILVDEKIIVIWFNIGQIVDSESFFLFLIQKAVEELEDLVNTESIQKFELLQNKIINAETIVERNSGMSRFFRLIKTFDFRLIYILDEFDSVSKCFQLSDFQFLRELSINPEYKICLVTISRRSIQELEPENGAISNFFGVFTDLRLGMFSNNDWNEYWNRLTKFSIEVSDVYKNKVHYLVGKHPYLIDLYNYHVFNFLHSNSLSEFDMQADEIERELSLTLFTNFDTSLDLIKEENLYNKAFQLIFGPIYDATSIDEQRLLKYQFIKSISKEDKSELLGRQVGLITTHNLTYICFSEYLTEYWNIKFAEIDFWPLWKEFEKKVREIIKYFLTEKFGDAWEDKYLEINQSSQGHLEAIKRLQSIRQYSITKFGTLASNNLIDYTLTRDLYDHFISPNWDWFKNVFDTDSKKDWAKKFNVLADIRNPIAHNNNEFLSEDRILEGKIYCEKILQKISLLKNDL